MEPGTIVALVGIGVLFFLVLFIWFTAENAHKKVKTEFKFATGSAFAFQQQISNMFINYAGYMNYKTQQAKDLVTFSIEEWMLTMDQLIEPAEVARLRTYLNDKLNADTLEKTITINQEIVADLGYASSNAKQAILIALNKLDNYLYDTTIEHKTEAKAKLLAHQVGTTFAASLAYVVG